MLGRIHWPEVRLSSQGGGLGIRVGVTFLLKKLGKLKWYCDRKMHIAIESILPLTATPVQGSTYTPLMVWILLRSYLGFHIRLSVWKPTLACFGSNKNSSGQTASWAHNERKDKLITSQQLNLSINRWHHCVACLILHQNGTCHLSRRPIYEVKYVIEHKQSWHHLPIFFVRFSFPPNKLELFFIRTVLYVCTDSCACIYFNQWGGGHSA